MQPDGGPGSAQGAGESSLCGRPCAGIWVDVPGHLRVVWASVLLRAAPCSRVGRKTARFSAPCTGPKNALPFPPLPAGGISRFCRCYFVWQLLALPEALFSALFDVLFIVLLFVLLVVLLLALPYLLVVLFSMVFTSRCA